MNKKVFHLSVRGASHEMSNKPLQDASADYEDDCCMIAVVCDGHGGDDYIRSDKGSGKGCDIAKKYIKEFILGMEKNKFFSDPDGYLRHLEASIINGWNEAVKEDCSKTPFSEEELRMVSDKAYRKYKGGEIEGAYGTTMIAVAADLIQDYWFGIQIGDGKCVDISSEGTFSQPIPWDSKCFLNQTTSMCDSDAIGRFRHYYSDKLPAAVFIGSDGIDDCFRDDEQLYQLYKVVLYSFASTDFEEARAQLEDYLHRLSAKGSRDDVSIAAIMDLDVVSELPVVKEFDKDKEKARVAEDARKEAEKREAARRKYEEGQTQSQAQNDGREKSQTVLELDLK